MSAEFQFSEKDIDLTRDSVLHGLDPGAGEENDLNFLLGAIASRMQDSPLKRGINNLLFGEAESTQQINVYKPEFAQWQLINNPCELDRRQARFYQDTYKSNREAYQDELTEIPNRRALEQKLDRYIKQMNSQVDRRKNRLKKPTSLAIVYMDLDGFKPINDVHGHLAGDEALRDFATKLSNGIRFRDMVARVGGDEFVVVMNDNINEDDVLEFIQRADRLAKEIEVIGEAGMLSVSAGFAMLRDGDTAKSVIDRADREMLRTKELKKQDK